MKRAAAKRSSSAPAARGAAKASPTKKHATVPSQRVASVRNSANASSVRSPYDGAAQTRRTLTWRAPTTSPNSHLGSLATLRDRARAATRNDGYAKSIIDKLVSNVIGTGLTPLSQVVDPELKRAISERWNDWTDVSDADGLLDFYGQQSQACRGWFEAGESFVRLRPRLPADRLPVPLQLQVLEAEMCPHSYDTQLPNGNRVRAGIEFDAIGRRVAYWFHPSRPGSLEDYDTTQLRRVPADLVIHLYDPLRAGQLRGLPILTPALVRLWELDKLDDAYLLRQQLANLIAGFVKTTSNAGDTPIDVLTGQDVTVGDDEKPFVSLEAGTMQELDPGTEVQWSNPPEPASTYSDFVKQQLRAACVGAGVPFEIVTGDLTGLNDRTMRVLLNEFRRRIMAWQHQVVAHQLCRRVWSNWMDRAFLAAALPIPVDYIETPTKYARVRWQPQAWPYLNPVQDVEAKKAAIRSGLSTRAAEVGEQGDDVDLIDQQNAEDNARADKLGLRYDSDGRQPASGPAKGETAPADPALQGASA